eukprot:scaffold11429_cov109-Isochrysis_galbana.AAC.3
MGDGDSARDYRGPAASSSPLASPLILDIYDASSPIAASAEHARTRGAYGRSALGLSRALSLLGRHGRIHHITAGGRPTQACPSTARTPGSSWLESTWRTPHSPAAGTAARSAGCCTAPLVPSTPRTGRKAQLAAVSYAARTPPGRPRPRRPTAPTGSPPWSQPARLERLARPTGRSRRAEVSSSWTRVPRGTGRGARWRGHGAGTGRQAVDGGRTGARAGAGLPCRARVGSR